MLRMHITQSLPPQSFLANSVPGQCAYNNLIMALELMGRLMFFLFATK